jgi:hypothetical protein
MRSLTKMLVLSAALGGAACAGSATPSDGLSDVLSPVDRTVLHEALIAEAEASEEVAARIDLLQRAGWTGGDLAAASTLANRGGAVAIAVAFSRPAEHAVVDLIYMHEPEEGLRAVLRPGDGDSAAVLVRSLEDLDAQGATLESQDGGAPAPDLSAGIALLAFNPPSSCGYLTSNQGLARGQSLGSCNGAYRLVMQSDGNLVSYFGGSVVWASNTAGRGGDHLVMQSDGNLVMYPASGGAVWATNTSGHSGAYFRLQNDANLVVYSGSTALWATNTYCEGSCTGVCRRWSCTYNLAGTGSLPGCVIDSNPGGVYYWITTRSGRTDPGRCAALYADAYGNGHSCPNPNHLSQTPACGSP